jgi:hypothetical protein
MPRDIVGFPEKCRMLPDAFGDVMRYGPLDVGDTSAPTQLRIPVEYILALRAPSHCASRAAVYGFEFSLLTDRRRG